MEDSDNENRSENIDAQKKAIYSQEVLASKLNISRQAVSRWETGEAIPDTEKVIQLSKLFAVLTDYLLLEEIEEWQDNSNCADHCVEIQTAPKTYVWNRKTCGIGILGVGTVCILLTIIFAGSIPKRWMSGSRTMVLLVQLCSTLGASFFCILA